MGTFLRLASPDDTTRINHEGGDWIEVRSNLSKKDMDNILRSLPRSMVSSSSDGKVSFELSEAQDMAYSLFKATMVSWSLDVPCTFDNYMNLSSEAAQWIDTQLYEHFASLQTTKAEKGKVSTSQKA